MTRNASSRVRSVGLFGLAAALCAVVWSARVSAHEIGTSRVVVSIDPSDHYRIEIVTDALSLLDKLEVVSGQSARPLFDRPAGQIQTRLTELESVFRQRVKVAFDDVALEPSIRFAVVPADATDLAAASISVPGATITLTGSVPATARQFTWSFGWTFASYALTVGDQPAPTARPSGWKVAKKALRLCLGHRSQKPIGSRQPPATSPLGLPTSFRRAWITSCSFSVCSCCPDESSRCWRR